MTRPSCGFETHRALADKGQPRVAQSMHDLYTTATSANEKTRMPKHTGYVIGRNGGIRTRDPLHPMQVRYQAALHSEDLNYTQKFDIKEKAAP